MALSAKAASEAAQCLWHRGDILCVCFGAVVGIGCRRVVLAVVVVVADPSDDSFDALEERGLAVDRKIDAVSLHLGGAGHLLWCDLLLLAHIGRVVAVGDGVRVIAVEFNLGDASLGARRRI